MPEPVDRTLQTRASLATDLADLGICPGGTLLVRSSLRALGWVVGCQLAVVQALLDALGPDGTIVVPAQTGYNSDPAAWHGPAVPEAWWGPDPGRRAPPRGRLGLVHVLHLAEYRVPGLPRDTRSCAVLGPDGHRAWTTYEDVTLDADDFDVRGGAYEASPEVTSGLVGEATSHLFPVAGAVAFATEWLAANRLRRSS